MQYLHGTLIVDMRTKRLEIVMEKKVYGVKLKDSRERMESQSGGAFFAMAREIIEAGGIVYGVSLNEELVAVYKRATEQSELTPMKGSKYVQVRMDNAYTNVAQDLDCGYRVLFSGTPCCVKGLTTFLEVKKIDCSKLICCDIVCHGVTSPLIFSEYIDSISCNRKYKIENFVFRDKEMGWRSCVETYIIDGKKHKSAVYAHLYSGHNCLRESCYGCKFTNYNRPSDVTIGDFWGIERFHPELDDNTGTSLMILNSKKGMELFEETKKVLDVFESNELEISQPPLFKPFPRPVTYNQFWKDYHERDFNYIIYQYGKGGWKGILKSFLKEATKKIGCYNYIHTVWMTIRHKWEDVNST